MNNANQSALRVPRVIGAGVVVLDVILNNGDTAPIFRAGGTCGNVLSGLSFLGWQSIAISRAGSDLAGDIMIHDLRNNGVNTDNITREANLATPIIIERLRSNGKYASHKFLMRCPSCRRYLPSFRSPRKEIAAKAYEKFDVASVYFFDRVTPSTMLLAKQYQESNTLIFFEPSSFKDMHLVEEGISMCHCLKYSIDRVEGFSGLTVYDRIQELVNHYQIPLVIQTVGEQGLQFRIYGQNKWYTKKSYRPQELHDTCGAGDWTTVGFLYELGKIAESKGIDLVKAFKSHTAIDRSLDFAQIVSSMSCMFVGARGMSTSLDKDTLLQHVVSRKGTTCTQVPMVKSKAGKYREIAISTIQVNRKLCSVCLHELDTSITD
ncbi:MAG: PfkB family carbohydrate kinase [Dehalococcoidia bacterium]